MDQKAWVSILRENSVTRIKLTYYFFFLEPKLPVWVRNIQKPTASQWTWHLRTLIHAVDFLAFLQNTPTANLKLSALRHPMINLLDLVLNSGRVHYTSNLLNKFPKRFYLGGKVNLHLKREVALLEINYIYMQFNIVSFTSFLINQKYFIIIIKTCSWKCWNILSDEAERCAIYY